MEGLIINAHGSGIYRDSRPGQQPVFYCEGVPVFEIWFWDAISKLWFVMVADLERVAAQGAVGFHPLHTKAQVVAIRDQWRAHRAAGGLEPNSYPGH